MLYDKLQLEKDEVVLKTVRKHWFVIVTELITVVFVAFLPITLITIIGSNLDVLKSAGITILLDGQLVAFLTSAWLLLSILAGFTIWTHYYLDLWIVTDRRIISVDQIHFFNRSVAIFRLERLQDIEYNINGFLPTFLNFGTISAQTAGHHEHNFRATGMPDPRGLQSAIQSAMDTRLRVLHIEADLSE